MIRLLADNSLEPRKSLSCNGLSRILFTVYLEAAMRSLRSWLPRQPAINAGLPFYVEYADDIDVVNFSRDFLTIIAPDSLAEWLLTHMPTSTEATCNSIDLFFLHKQ